MTSIVPNDFLAESSPACELSRIGAVEREHLVGRAELAVVGGNRVVGDRDAADRGRDGDGEERQHEELLPPLAAEHAPGPADDRAAGGDAAVARSAQRRPVSERRHRRSPAASSDSGPAGASRLVDDVAVAQEDDAVRPGSQLRLVGHDDTRDAPMRRGAQQAHDRLAVHGVERTRRFVGEQQPALADDRPRDRDPLALAARQLVGVAVGVVGDVELLHRLECRRRVRPSRETPSSSSGRVTFSSAVSPGSRLKSWKT